MNSVLFFIFLSLTPTFLHHSLAAQPPKTTTTTTNRFIKESCTTTTYPKLCYTTLSTYASQIQTNPKVLATKSLAVALAEAKSAFLTMGRLSRVHGLRPKEASALSDCTTAMGSSEAQLQSAIDQLGHGPSRNGPSSEMVMSDVETWTSTALTYAGTCMEGFEGRDMNGNIKTMVRSKVMKMTQLISNALALVNSYGSTRKAHHHRNNNP